MDKREIILGGILGAGALAGAGYYYVTKAQQPTPLTKVYGMFLDEDEGTMNSLTLLGANLHKDGETLSLEVRDVSTEELIVSYEYSGENDVFTIQPDSNIDKAKLRPLWKAGLPNDLLLRLKSSVDQYDGIDLKVENNTEVLYPIFDNDTPTSTIDVSTEYMIGYDVEVVKDGSVYGINEYKAKLIADNDEYENCHSLLFTWVSGASGDDYMKSFSQHKHYNNMLDHDILIPYPKEAFEKENPVHIVLIQYIPIDTNGEEMWDDVISDMIDIYDEPLPRDYVDNGEFSRFRFDLDEEEPTLTVMPDETHFPEYMK